MSRPGPEGGKVLILAPDEMRCPKCWGAGEVYLGSSTTSTTWCPLCHGRRRVKVGYV